MSGCLHYATAPGVNVGIGVAIGIAMFAAAATLGFVCRDKADQTLKEWLGVWVFAGTRNLRNTFQVRRAACCPLVCVCCAVLRAVPKYTL